MRCYYDVASAREVVDLVGDEGQDAQRTYLGQNLKLVPEHPEIVAISPCGVQSGIKYYNYKQYYENIITINIIY